MTYLESSIEDPKAIARAVAHSNHPDRSEETLSQPEMGSETPAHKMTASQANGAGSGIPAKSKKKPVTGLQRKALNFIKRSEAGGAETTGGGNGAE
jgi:hypothetical protein